MIDRGSVCSLDSASTFILGIMLHFGTSLVMVHVRNLSVASGAFLSASPVQLRIPVGPQHLSVTCSCSDPWPKIFIPTSPLRLLTTACLLFGHHVVCCCTKFELLGMRIVFRSLAMYQFSIPGCFCCWVQWQLCCTVCAIPAGVFAVCPPWQPLLSGNQQAGSYLEAVDFP